MNLPGNFDDKAMEMYNSHKDEIDRIASEHNMSKLDAAKKFMQDKTGK